MVHAGCVCNKQPYYIIFLEHADCREAAPRMACLRYNSMRHNLSPRPGTSLLTQKLLYDSLLAVWKRSVKRKVYVWHFKNVNFTIDNQAVFLIICHL